MVADELNHLEDVGYRLSQVAVFYRTNAQSRVLEEVMVRRGIPYTVVGSVRFYERREVKDVLAYLRAVVNPTDEVALKRVINVPKRGSDPPPSGTSSASPRPRGSVSSPRCVVPVR